MTKEQIKDKLYDDAIKDGKRLMDAMNKDITTKEIEALDKATQEDIKRTLEAYALKKFINDIRERKITNTTLVKKNTDYEFAYYTVEFAKLVGLPEYIVYAEKIKDKSNKDV